MKVLGLDLSTVASGYCALDGEGKVIKSGVIRPVDEIAPFTESGTKKAAKESLTELKTFIHVTRRASEIIDELRPDVLVVEDAFFKVNASVLRLLARLSGGVLKHWISKYEPSGERTYVVMASRARATVGCKGNATKDEVKKFIEREFGVHTDDDNEADAYILARYGLTQVESRTKARRGKRCRRARR